ncbi:MAG: hypothetical protein IJ594_08480 [Oscillospiraceae bacterium]|nr:hypothetical protein [Oscillospiraceae bacterium]
MDEGKKLLDALRRIKYPLLMLALGLLLLLLPGRGSGDAPQADADQLLQQALASTEGVGEVCVLTSENGAVVVCQGAENAKARLDVIRAVYAYTGLTSDKITVLKMVDRS